MSKYLEGGEAYCPINSRWLEFCIEADNTKVTLPRGLLSALVEVAQTETDGLTPRKLEPHRQMLLDYVYEQIGGAQAAADLAFLAHYLKHDGQLRHALNIDIHVEAMALLDGYGKMDEHELRGSGLTWDWSHVRDSSPEALAECRTFIEDIMQFSKEQEA